MSPKKGAQNNPFNYTVCWLVRDCGNPINVTKTQYFIKQNPQFCFSIIYLGDKIGEQRVVLIY